MPVYNVDANGTENYIQRPQDDLDYPFNWAAYLALVPNETILTSTFAISAGAAIRSPSFNTTSATVFVNSGVLNSKVALTNTITTLTRIQSRTIFIYIQESNLIVEDGTGKPNAESYCDAVFADFYHQNRGNIAWLSLPQLQKEGFLRKATDYMIGAYRGEWKGRRVLITQALDWPRVGVVLEDFGGSMGRNHFGSYGLFQVDYTIVPVELKNACAELALRASIGPLNDDLKQNIISKTVGPIKVMYDKESPQTKRFPAIEAMLRIYFQGGVSGTHKLVRT